MSPSFIYARGSLLELLTLPFFGISVSREDFFTQQPKIWNILHDYRVVTSNIAVYCDAFWDEVNNEKVDIAYAEFSVTMSWEPLSEYFEGTTYV